MLNRVEVPEAVEPFAGVLSRQLVQMVHFLRDVDHRFALVQPTAARF